MGEEKGAGGLAEAALGHHMTCEVIDGLVDPG